MPLISTFGAASARAFGLQTGAGTEPPGSWFAPEAQDLVASYQPSGYDAVTLTIIGVNGGGSGYGGSNRKWNYSNATKNQPSSTPGNKVGKSSKVSGSVNPVGLGFRTPAADSSNATNTRGWTSGANAASYSGSRANLANQQAYSGTAGGAAVVAYNGNTRIAVAAGGGAAARPDRNSNAYGNSYSAKSYADQYAGSNTNTTNSNNGTSSSGNACYYTSGGSGGGERGGAAANSAGNQGGYSGNSYATGFTLTAGQFQDATIGTSDTAVGIAKIEWS